MARVDVSQIDVIEAVAARLQAALTLSEQSCYPVARAVDVPSVPKGGDFWLTIAPGPGNFEPEEQIPGSTGPPTVVGNVTENSDVTVSIYTRIKTDQAGHDRYLLLSDARGLLAIKKLVLAALVGQDLTDTAGDTFLRQLLFATNATAPDLVKPAGSEATYGCLRVTFGTVFDWDLT